MTIPKLISKEEAAKLLSVKPSSINRYWRTGKLSWRVVNRKRRCVYQEVENLREGKAKYTSMNVKDGMFMLKYKIERLEKRIELLETKLSMARTVVYTDKDLIGMYNTAAKHKLTKVTLKTAATWAGSLTSIAEEELSRLKVLVDSPCPWAPFLKFIDNMVKSLSRKRDYNSNKALLSVTQTLLITRDNIKRAGENVFHQEGPKGLRNASDYLDTLDLDTGPIKPLSTQ